MTIARLRSEMSADEFTRWAVYYARLAAIQQIEQAKGR